MVTAEHHQPGLGNLPHCLVASFAILAQHHQPAASRAGGLRQCFPEARTCLSQHLSSALQLLCNKAQPGNSAEVQSSL